YTSLRIALITATDFTRFVLGSGGGASALAEAVQLGHDAPVVVEFGGASPADVAAIPIEAPPVVSLLDHILATALRRDASEIHIEPYDGVTRVRLRVDGQLLTLISAPRRLHEPLLARLRATAGDLAEATIRLSAEGREGRYSLIPLETTRGQKLVLKRALHEARGLADLGLSSKVRARLSKCFAPPEGLILVTGPRDSGRTTAVSALAAFANHPMRQVIFASRHGHATVPGAISLPLTGTPTDARLIERALSHNPDVLVLDGIELNADDRRNDGPDLAAVAVRAALDGHLVIASVSAPRAADAIVRLVGSGVPAWQIAASLQAVVAQRLVRAVHEPCSAAVELSPAEIDELKLPRDALDKARLRGARGCGACYGTGFLGRTAVSEVLFGAPALREAIRLGRPTEAQLIDAGRADGFASLWEDSIVKLLSGKTTLDELRAVLAE
ncbi:MAG: Flp pilus assembly complex ATPase component TadA, partial [Myxococcales bacterium]|nr:Flp pilus assembly complex ATPase component TadA [Myxococcales bacterium]